MSADKIANKIFSLFFASANESEFSPLFSLYLATATSLLLGHFHVAAAAELTSKASGESPRAKSAQGVQQHFLLVFFAVVRSFTINGAAVA